MVVDNVRRTSRGGRRLQTSTNNQFPGDEMRHAQHRARRPSLPLIDWEERHGANLVVAVAGCAN